VCRDGDGGLRIAGVDPLRLGVEVRLLAARQHHLGAPGDERVGDRATDSATCSGDDRDAVFEIEFRHHW